MGVVGVSAWRRGIYATRQNCCRTVKRSEGGNSQIALLAAAAALALGAEFGGRDVIPVGFARDGVPP